MTERIIEQRQFPRYALAERMYCYLDGARFDARSRDISAGGLFIRTPKRVPLGAHIALVFKDRESDGSAPVFLVGRVVRRQDEPVPGIGMRWERATTEGDAKALEHFLVNRMGVLPNEILTEIYGPKKEVRHAFYFGDNPKRTEQRRRSSDAANLQEKTPSPQARPAFKVTEPEFVRKHDGQMPPTEPTPLPERVVRVSDGNPGPLSVMLQRGESLAPVTLDATVELGEGTQQGLIRGMSVKRMFLLGTEGIGMDSGSFKVSFRLPAQAGWATISCDCHVIFEDPGDGPLAGGLEVEIDGYDEGEAKGLLWSYLKWVTFRQIRGEES